MSTFITAIGLALVIEGLLYAIAPGRLKDMLIMVEKMPEDAMRMLGLAAIAAGVVIVWVARSFL